MRASWDLVLGKILNHSQYDELESLFHLLLTEEERSAVASRLKVFQLLLEGNFSQRQIASEYENQYCHYYPLLQLPQAYVCRATRRGQGADFV